MIQHVPSGTYVRFDFQAPEGHLEPRLVQVLKVRDLEKEPLSSESIAKRPDLERSRFVIKAFDFAQQGYRDFYSCKISNWQVTDLPALIVMANRVARKAG